MLIRILAGSKQGQLVHVAREQATTLLCNLGLIEETAPPPPQVVHPTKGWKIVMLGQHGDKARIVYDSGSGERRVYEGIPPSTERRWVYHSENHEGYEDVPVPNPCPLELIEHYKNTFGSELARIESDNVIRANAARMGASLAAEKENNRRRW